MMISCAAFSHTVRQNWLVCGAAASEIASLRLKTAYKNTPKYNLATKPSVYSGLGAQKITLSWKIMATIFKIDAIDRF